MSSLNEVHEAFKKWLNIEDTNRIDIALAVALTREIKGTKLWLIFVGPSGDAKSEIINSFDDGGLHTYILHKLTPKTLISGSTTERVCRDLAPFLKDKLVVISDYSEILTMSPTDKNAVFGQLRELYDGRAGGATGSGSKAKYSDLNVTLMACSTPAIDSQFLIHQILGTRELIYRTKGNERRRDLLKKIRKNEKQEEEMRLELRTTIASFLIDTSYNNIEIEEEAINQLFNYATYCCILRAQADVDNYTGDVNQEVIIEEPTRIFKQLIRIYKALMSLDANYKEENAFDIIKHIIESSGVQLRQRVLETLINLKEENKNPITTTYLSSQLRVNRKTVYKELNILWNLRILEKESMYDQYNREIQHNWSLNENWEKKWLL